MTPVVEASGGIKPPAREPGIPSHACKGGRVVIFKGLAARAELELGAAQSQVELDGIEHPVSVGEPEPLHLHGFDVVIGT